MNQTELKFERALIGRRLRVARERAGASIEDAAAAAYVQPVAIKAWERGKSMPCPVQFRLLLGFYGVGASTVLFDKTPYELSRAESAELLALSDGCTPALRSRLELYVALFGVSTSLDRAEVVQTMLRPLCDPKRKPSQ
jgi:transcriptional regulator with XRE-family HTH domain